MISDGFDEGVAPGGLKDADDIKILICYLLKSVGGPLSFDNLNEILQHDGLCNYFGFASALHELLVTGHVGLVRDGEPRQVAAHGRVQVAGAPDVGARHGGRVDRRRGRRDAPPR